MTHVFKVNSGKKEFLILFVSKSTLSLLAWFMNRLAKVIRIGGISALALY